jgi:nucleobase:cation symporter-1, NCS1 family
VSSANGFLSFLSGYSIFQGSLVSIMTVDYFLIRRGNLHISEMFTTSRSGRYYYTYGVNWTGVAAFIAGFCLPLPGFIQSFGTVTITNPAATYMYDLGWVLSYLVGGVSYFAVSMVTARRTMQESRKMPFEGNVPKSIAMGAQKDVLVVDGTEIVVGVPGQEQEGSVDGSVGGVKGGVSEKVAV